MRNLKPFSGDSFDFYKEIIARKYVTGKDPTYKDRMLLLNGALANHFKEYDTFFGADNLQSLIASNYSGQDKKDLLALYAYNSSILQKLKIGVTTAELNRVINTCQNCTIGEINSFDHAIPQQEFSEFVVHPKNLFPCCSKCNGHKSSVWRAGGSRLFLNLYLDALPSQQYLYVKVIVNGRDIETDFYVDNNAGIEAALFKKIEYHYTKLRLCARFSENNDTPITFLKNTIVANLENLGRQEIVNTASATIQRNRNAFGFNYWQSILELELLKSDDFFKLCETEI